MAKIDKTQFSKSEWRLIREQRRREKDNQKIEKTVELKENKLVHSIPPIDNNHSVAFVCGNGTSRKSIELESLRPHGKIYACNAVYRTFRPDYLVAVDVKMVLEINKAGFQHHNQVWTNPNKSYQHIKNLNLFQPSKGWSSGPTALWLASQHKYDKIFILGFDYKGLEGGSKLNNIYADTPNYKKSTDGATFFGNWMRQTKNILQTHRHIKFYRVITPDNYIPEELNNFNNLEHIYIEDFKKMFSLT